MLSALLLFLYNGYEERRAGQEAELLLDDIQSAIAKETDPTIGPTEIEIEITESTEPTETLPVEMPVVMTDGYDLVLCTCTPGGVTRLVAFCDRVAEEIDGER